MRLTQWRIKKSRHGRWCVYRPLQSERARPAFAAATWTQARSALVELQRRATR